MSSIEISSSCFGTDFLTAGVVEAGELGVKFPHSEFSHFLPNIIKFSHTISVLYLFDPS